MVDDMKKVQGVLEELMRNRYSGGGGNVFNDIGPKILLKWHGKDKEEKCKVF